jgi:hypothetical protein
MFRNAGKTQERILVRIDSQQVIYRSVDSPTLGVYFGAMLPIRIQKKTEGISLRAHKKKGMYAVDRLKFYLQAVPFLVQLVEIPYSLAIPFWLWRALMPALLRKLFRCTTLVKRQMRPITFFWYDRLRIAVLDECSDVKGLRKLRDENGPHAMNLARKIANACNLYEKRFPTDAEMECPKNSLVDFNDFSSFRSWLV